MIRVSVYGLLWVLLMGVAIFASQNLLLVAIEFLAFKSINLPLGLVLVFSAGLGAIATTAWQKIGQTEPAAEAGQIPTKPASSYKSSSSYSAPSPSTSQSTSTKNTPKNSRFDDFDEDWDEDWG